MVDVERSSHVFLPGIDIVMGMDRFGIGVFGFHKTSCPRVSLLVTGHRTIELDDIFWVPHTVVVIGLRESEEIRPCGSLSRGLTGAAKPPWANGRSEKRRKG
jgi:hypothetical protein